VPEGGSGGSASTHLSALIAMRFSPGARGACPYGLVLVIGCIQMIRSQHDCLADVEELPRLILDTPRQRRAPSPHC
jgi:hypothetical protein